MGGGNGGGNGQGKPGGSAHGGGKQAMNPGAQGAFRPPGFEVEQRRLLAAGSDPDRDRRSRRDLGGGGDDQAAPPTSRPDRRGLPRGKLTVAQERKRPAGQIRAWLGAAAVLFAALAVAAPPRPAPCRLISGGFRPQATPTSNSSSGCARAASTASGSRSPGARSSRGSGGTANFSASDQLVASAAAAGLDVLPFVYDAPPWAVRAGAGATAAVRRRRRPCRSRPAPSAAPGRTSSSWCVARYGPSGTFWADNPASRPVRSAPGRSGTSRTSSTSSQAQPGRIRQAGQASPTRRSKASTRAPR